MTSVRIQATPRGTTLRLNGRDITSLIEPGSTSIEWRDGAPVVTFRVAAPELLADLDGAMVSVEASQVAAPKRTARKVPPVMPPAGVVARAPKAADSD